jgi:hypothetical protein
MEERLTSVRATGPRLIKRLRLLKAVGLCAVGFAAVSLGMGGCGSNEDGDTAKTTDDLDKRLNELRAVPYTSVTEEPVEAHESGVVHYDPAKAWNGYNLFSAQVTPRAYLLDMNGNVVREWRYPERAKGLWHHVVMLADGSAVIVNMYNHLLKLDWDSELVWKRPMYVHHDVVELPDGSFYVIGVELWTYRGLIVRFPAIVHLTSEGEQTSKWSSLRHLDEIKQVFDTRSFLDTVLDSMLARNAWPAVYDEITKRPEIFDAGDGEVQYDHFHMNTINLLPDTPLGRTDNRFGAGNLLVCFRNVNQIGVIEKGTMRPVWAWGEGVLEWPHHPTMLENGNILVFDNGVKRGYSRVIEIDPGAGTIVWDYVGEPPESFYSYGKGSAQRLPNGNTLICSGDQGRTFEVTRDGEIVWEWFNPMITGRRRVQIYRMMRLSPDVVEPLLRDGNGAGDEVRG